MGQVTRQRRAGERRSSLQALVRSGRGQHDPAAAVHGGAHAGHENADEEEMDNRSEDDRAEYGAKDGAREEDLELGDLHAGRSSDASSFGLGRPAGSNVRGRQGFSGAPAGASLRRSNAWLSPPNACQNSDGIRKTLFASPRASSGSI